MKKKSPEREDRCPGRRRFRDGVRRDAARALWYLRQRNLERARLAIEAIMDRVSLL